MFASLAAEFSRSLRRQALQRDARDGVEESDDNNGAVRLLVRGAGRVAPASDDASFFGRRRVART